MTRCGAGSDKSTCSPTCRTGATRSPSCSTATGSRPRRCSASPTGRTCRRRRSCSHRPTAEGRLPRPHLHARPRAAVRRPSDARDVPRLAQPSGGRAHRDDVVVQECAAGLITIRTSGDRLAFAAPPLVRSGPVDEAFVERIASVLRIDRADILAAEWVDNGPGWVAVLLDSADAVLAAEARRRSTSTSVSSARTRRARPTRSRCGRSSRRTA